MSEFTDRTLARYLAQQPGTREALLSDPIQHAQAERMRQTLDATDCAMADEDVPEEVRRRVINRIVWGESEGRVDMHAQMDKVRKQISDAYNLPPDLMRVWDAIPSAGPARPGEEPTT
jgi:hypothetical protein